MTKKILSFALSLALVLSGGFFTVAPAQAQQPVRSGGQFVASNYGKWSATVFNGFTGTGTQTMSMLYGYVTLPDGRPFVPFNVRTPLSVDTGSNRETVTPTAVSGCAPLNPNQGVCQVTASFSNAHGNGTLVTSGDGGLQEAIEDAAQLGSLSAGGVVLVDASSGITNAQLAAAVPWDNVSILDTRFGTPQYWTPLGGSTVLAAPATLTNSTAGFGVNGANFTGGAYTGNNTYIACIAYVDVMGQEGPCSATFTIATSGSASTDQIGFTAPAASTGAVGYTIYITLNGGSYTSAYKVPLVTQPSAVGAYPASNGVCTLTTVETVTPACAVTNNTYGSVGSGAVVSALTLNTSQIEPQTTVISTTSIYVPQPGGRTTYTFAPGQLANGATISKALAFSIGAAAATTVPDVIGTINLAPGAMNIVGKTLRVCGIATTTASTATIVDIQFQWDANGQNTAGKGVLIGDLTATPSAALATAGHATFCQDFMTTVTSASATGGTIQEVNGFGAVGGLTLIGTGALSDSLAGASAGGVGSLNLADAARINVIYLHTTGTDGAGWTLQNLTAQVL